MTKTTTIYTLSEKNARKKIMKWYADKKNLKILSCLPVQNDDKGFEILFSYSENNE